MNDSGEEHGFIQRTLPIKKLTPQPISSAIPRPDHGINHHPLIPRSSLAIQNAHAHAHAHALCITLQLLIIIVIIIAILILHHNHARLPRMPDPPLLRSENSIHHRPRISPRSRALSWLVILWRFMKTSFFYRSTDFQFASRERGQPDSNLGCSFTWKVWENFL
jgi:hypothetical protein